MKTINSLTRYQAFRWLWRYDNEAKWFWLKVYLFSRADLRKDVRQNYDTFGATSFE